MLKGFKNILIYIFFPSIFTMFFTTNIYSKKYMFYLLISYILLTIYFLIIYKKDLKEYIKNFKLKNIPVILIYWIIGFILMMISNYITNYLIIPNGLSNNEAGNRELLFNNKLIYSIILCILIPTLEEITFRLEFKKNIKKQKIFILVSSITFALLHILSTTKLIELLYIIPYFILGLTFSKIYIKTDNLISSIIAHILHNTTNVIILLLF